MIRSFLLILCILCTFFASAQTRGGEIRRVKSNKVVKKRANADKHNSSQRLTREMPIVQNSTPLSNSNSDAYNIIEMDKYNLNTSKGCYDKANILRREGDGYLAIEYYKKAFVIGEPPYRLWALCQIGKIYYQGLGGVSQNFVLAFGSFKQASDMGCLPATYYVGICYEYGRGVGQNKNVAEQYYTKSGYNSIPSLDF